MRESGQEAVVMVHTEMRVAESSVMNRETEELT